MSAETKNEAKSKWEEVQNNFREIIELDDHSCGKVNQVSPSKNDHHENRPAEEIVGQNKRKIFLLKFSQKCIYVVCLFTLVILCLVQVCFKGNYCYKT